jgi:putative hydrolase of the HAD superfamily
LLNDLGLASYFEVLAISCESGCTKPGEAIFNQAVQELGFSPKCVLHIGDGLREDAGGAKAAGLQALHLVRGVNNPVDDQINSLSGLHLHLQKTD